MTLQEFIIKTTPIAQSKADLIASYFHEEDFEKNTHLIREGSICRKCYFIQSGIIRRYLFNNEGEEITTRFYTGPDFLNDYFSFFRQEPSDEFYQTLTPCKAWAISLEKVQYCFHHIPEFRELGRMLLILNSVEMHKRMISFHKYDATERYLQLIEQKPALIQEVSLKYIASYLGVTKHSLSRIRRKITPS